MGRRRRSQKKVATKKRATVSKVFKCPFCSMDDAVTCKIEHNKGLATLTCRSCGVNHQSVKVNYLTEPIDVFCEWYDECENANVDARGEDGDDEDE